MYLYQNKILIEMKIGGKKKKSDKHKQLYPPGQHHSSGILQETFI